MSRYGHFMKFCDKNGQNYHKMTISCVYELGGYLDNVLAELYQSGFCIATYLKEMLVEYSIPPSLLLLQAGLQTDPTKRRKKTYGASSSSSLL